MSTDQPILRNRLDTSLSPYLLAHADQPVAWQPWDEEAFARARRLQRPILLSSGYAACHWCHVMARESFSDPEIAAQINAAFLPIKLDREEHPEIDHYYMTALQVMGVPGGWPMTVFLLPDGRPFAGGTYFPPAPRQGMPGFPAVLARIAALWESDCTRVTEIARRVTEATARLIAEPDRARPAPAGASATSPQVGETLLGLIDPVHGGFGAAPKFPQVPALRLLWDMRHAPCVGENAQRAVTAALAAMVAGGIHDHIGGGFHRYTVDAAWQIPHFEKMLYDNAEILLLLAAVHSATPAAWLAETADTLVAWVESDMRLADGGFASALDAESEGREGAFYLWSKEELKAALGPDFATFADVFALPEGGHLDGSIVLNRRRRPDESDCWEEESRRLRPVRARLARIRMARARPARDDKAVAAWNGRMITALVAAGAVFGRPAWIASAEEQFVRLLALLRRADGRLARHVFRGEAGPEAGLADYAALAEACLALHAARLAPKWLELACELANLAHARFHDPVTGLYRLGPAKGLPQAPVLPDDGPAPAGTALLLDVFSRLARLLPAEAWSMRADALAAALSSAIADRHPLSASGCLLALRRHERAAHVTLSGPPPARDPAMAALHEAALGRMESGLVLSLEENNPPARAMLCLGRRCLPPVTEPAALNHALEHMHV